MTLAEVRVEAHGRVVVAYLDGEIDMSNADALGASLTNRMTNDALGLAIDLTAVRYLDSFGIQVVYELSERLRKRGQELRLVVKTGSTIARTLDLVDASSRIGVVETTEAAVAAIASLAPETG
jgi:anti-anti-sigma factor